MINMKSIAKQHLIDPLTYTWDDIGTGNLFAKTFKCIYRYVTEANLWYFFNGKVWIADTNNIKGEKLSKAIVEMMRQNASKI